MWNMSMQISSCLVNRRERGGYPFSFPLHLCIVLDEDLVNGLDGKSDGLEWDKDHVFESFEMECKSHVKKS